MKNDIRLVLHARSPVVIPLLAFLAFASVIAFSVRANAQHGTFVTFDPRVPDTRLSGINSGGIITGITPMRHSQLRGGMAGTSQHPPGAKCAQPSAINHSD
jgi:hypothetical protein